MPILTQETYVHLPIFFTAYAVQDLGELEAIPADIWDRLPVHHSQTAVHSHIHTYGQFTLTQRTPT